MYETSPNGIEPTAEWEVIREALAKTVAALIARDPLREFSRL